jgi:hypothetical protein
MHTFLFQFLQHPEYTCSWWSQAAWLSVLVCLSVTVQCGHFLVLCVPQLPSLMGLSWRRTGMVCSGGRTVPGCAVSQRDVSCCRHCLRRTCFIHTVRRRWKGLWQCLSDPKRLTMSVVSRSGKKRNESLGITSFRNSVWSKQGLEFLEHGMLLKNR